MINTLVHIKGVNVFRNELRFSRLQPSRQHVMLAVNISANHSDVQVDIHTKHVVDVKLQHKDILQKLEENTQEL